MFLQKNCLVCTVVYLCLVQPSNVAFILCFGACVCVCGWMNLCVCDLCVCVCVCVCVWMSWWGGGGIVMSANKLDRRERTLMIWIQTCDPFLHQVAGILSGQFMTSLELDIWRHDRQSLADTGTYEIFTQRALPCCAVCNVSRWCMILFKKTWTVEQSQWWICWGPVSCGHSSAMHLASLTIWCWV